MRWKWIYVLKINFHCLPGEFLNTYRTRSICQRTIAQLAPFDRRPCIVKHSTGLVRVHNLEFFDVFKVSLSSQGKQCDVGQGIRNITSLAINFVTSEDVRILRDIERKLLYVIKIEALLILSSVLLDPNWWDANECCRSPSVGETLVSRKIATLSVKG